MPASEAVTRCLLLVLLLLREAASSAATATPYPGGTYPPPPPPPPPPATAEASSVPTSASASAAAWASSSSSAAPSAQHQRIIEEDEGPAATDSSESSDSDPDSVTCYTCVNVSDNLVCNRFAIDRPCPRGEWFCHTLHIMDSRGESVVVHKKCADDTECTTQGVGCLQIDAQKICVSCCDEMYCNASVPTNHSNAVLTARRRHSHRGSSNPSSGTANSSAAPLLSSPRSVGRGGRRPLSNGLGYVLDSSLRFSSLILSILSSNIQRFALQ